MAHPKLANPGVVIAGVTVSPSVQCVSGRRLDWTGIDACPTGAEMRNRVGLGSIRCGPTRGHVLTAGFARTANLAACAYEQSLDLRWADLVATQRGDELS